jgi:hypothetical protein
LDPSTIEKSIASARERTAAQEGSGGLWTTRPSCGFSTKPVELEL